MLGSGDKNCLEMGLEWVWDGFGKGLLRLVDGPEYGLQ